MGWHEGAAMREQTHYDPNRIRWIVLAVALLGIGILVMDSRQGPSDAAGGLFRVRSVWSIIGLSLLGAAVVSWLVVLVTTRCPFCGKWIDPWYHPRRGMHCPKCGKTRE
jgi:hypothetical protein